MIARRYRVSSVRFHVVREAAPARGRLHLSAPSEAADFARQSPTFSADDGREHFALAMLDAQNGVIAWHEVAHGSVSDCIVRPSEVWGAALRIPGVVAVVLFHNHPSGDPTPSKEDVRLTRELAAGGKLLGLQVHDHIVLGDGTASYVSLATQGGVL